MRITFLNTMYPPHGASGAENSLRLIAARMHSRGHTCSVLTLTPEAKQSEGEVDGIHTQYLPLANVYWPHAGRRPGVLRPLFQGLESYNPAMGRRAAKALAALRPDVLNCHNLQGFSVAAWRAAKALGIPVVQSIHDYYLACPRSAMWRPGSGNCEHQCAECRIFTTPRRMLSGIPACVTCVSHRVMERIAGTGMFSDAVVGQQPVRIIRGINAELTRTAEARRQHPPPAITLGFMGRLEPTKGVEILLEALPRLPRGARLLVAGSGPDHYVAALRGRAGEGVTFLGHVSPAEFYAQVDLLVIPSVWEDPFPRVFHEALAFGVPSLITPLGGLPEVIRPGHNGFIASGADAAALAEALSGLLTGGWDREAVRAACIAAATEYDAERIATQYERVLTAAAARQPIPEDAGSLWRPRGMPEHAVPAASEKVCHAA